MFKKGKIKNYHKPKIMNTDQGSQYTSNKHTQYLEGQGVSISMDGKGRATDNIAIERFWRSIKYEDIYLNDYKNTTELKRGIKNYIEFYNNKRFHAGIDYQKPMEVYENSMKNNQKMAA